MMHCYRLPKLIQTSRMLESFTTHDVAIMEQIILNELGTTDKKSLLRLILQLCQSKLSTESITIINNKANELSTKYAIIKENDQMSRLNSNVIQHFGAFLNKKESIAFGFLNRYLFIESHKKSFILNRRSINEDICLNSELLTNIINDKNDSVKYYYPTNVLCVDIDNGINRYDFDNFMSNNNNKILFESLFNSVSSIYLGSSTSSIYQHIPIHKLFDRKLNDNKSLNIDITAENNEYYYKELNKFLHNYQQYYQLDCNNENAKIRKINNLKITNISESKFDFTKLNGNFEHLEIDTYDQSIYVSSIDQLNTMIHKGLKSLTFSFFGHLPCPFAEVLINSTNNDNNITPKSQIQSIQFKLDCDSYDTTLQSTIITMNQLSLFNHLRCIMIDDMLPKHCYILHKKRRYGNGVPLETDWLARLINTNDFETQFPVQLKYIQLNIDLTHLEYDGRLTDQTPMKDILEPELITLTKICVQSGIEIEFNVEYPTICENIERYKKYSGTDRFIKYDTRSDQITIDIANTDKKQCDEHQIFNIFCWLHAHATNCCGDKQRYCHRTFTFKY